ncbi:MAG: RNA-binding cell elongation regulator Jag/EloR [Chloroflexota bacterium]|jgi:spoIIIJ-associated protein
MSEYQEFTGKTVEEALKKAREAFDAGGLQDIDFEILTQGSRGVLGMGAEPARIIAAPRSALGGAAPKKEAAEASAPPVAPPPRAEAGTREAKPRRGKSSEREGDRRRSRGGSRTREASTVSDAAATEVEAAVAASASAQPESAEATEAAEASPQALAAGKEILETLVSMMGYDASVEVSTGATAKITVYGTDDEEKEALGALIGRKGERLSALQHLVNLMLSRKMGTWTRVLVDVEDYRGRRERQLVEVATRAADRVAETGQMLQLEPMSALERRWVHLALRDREGITTQSIGEEPMRRVVVLKA